MLLIDVEEKGHFQTRKRLFFFLEQFCEATINCFVLIHHQKLGMKFLKRMP
ncbi:hypothetical protein ABH968_002513 [Lysinibacillus sp. RC79]